MQTIINETEIAVNDITSMIELFMKKVCTDGDTGYDLTKITEVIEGRHWSYEEVALIADKMRELISVLQSAHFETEMKLKNIALKQRANKIYSINSI